MSQFCVDCENMDEERTDRHGWTPTCKAFLETIALDRVTGKQLSETKYRTCKDVRGRDICEKYTPIKPKPSLWQRLFCKDSGTKTT
jgi:hypothetical protein